MPASPLAQRTLRTIRADLAERRLELLVRQMNARHEFTVCERELAVIERRLEMIASTRAA